MNSLRISKLYNLNSDYFTTSLQFAIIMLSYTFGKVDSFQTG